MGVRVRSFGSRKEAEDWSYRNGVAPADLDIKGEFGGRFTVYVRHAATDKSDGELRDSAKPGFF